MSVQEGEPNPGSRPDALKNFLDRYRLTRRDFLKGAAVTAGLILTEPIVKQTNILSRVAGIVRKLAKTAEVETQTIENPIYFIDSLGRQRKWEVRNATFGIPPNDPDRLTDTVDDYINNNYSYSFQPKTSLYPEFTQGDATSVVVFGVQVDSQTGKGYMATGMNINNIGYLRLESISVINNPIDYSDSARVVVKDGIGDIGQNGDLKDFYKSENSQGKYLDLVLSRSVDPSKNGTYRIRLDSQGNFSGSFFKVQEEGTPTPTSSPTPSPTPTPWAKFRQWLAYIPNLWGGGW